MKATHLTAVTPLKNSQYWLLAIAAGLVAIYMTLTWKAGDNAQLGMSGLFWLAVASSLWGKRHSLKLESGILPSIVGALLIALILWQGSTISGLALTNETVQSKAPFLRFIPFLSALGVGLLASGFKGLKQYWQEITILFFLGIPSIVLSSLTDISPITAKFSAFLLWYSGFQVSLQDVYITLPTGSVKVYGGCSGMEAMTYLLGLAVICLVMFPIQRSKQIFVPIVALIIGFVVNAIRVSLMAVLIAFSNRGAFDYWHEGEGSLIFGMISVLIFGLFYLFLLRQEDSDNQDTAES